MVMIYDGDIGEGRTVHENLFIVSQVRNIPDENINPCRNGSHVIGMKDYDGRLTYYGDGGFGSFWVNDLDKALRWKKDTQAYNVINMMGWNPSVVHVINAFQLK